jgi:hypothetical protein
MEFLVSFTSTTTEIKMVSFIEKNKSVEKLSSITKVVKIASSTEALLLIQKLKLTHSHLSLKKIILAKKW